MVQSEESEQEEVIKAEQAISKDKKAKEKKHLPLQQEKITRVSVEDRAQAWIQALTTDPNRGINRIEGLTLHLLRFPEGKGVISKEIIILYLLWQRKILDSAIQAAVREILALIRYVIPR